MTDTTKLFNPDAIKNIKTEKKAWQEQTFGPHKEQDVVFEVDSKLVRGLDYYTRTTFEIQTDMLGAQNAVAGGGRYDGLVKELGGPEQPAVGFAVGFDRLIEITSLNNEDFLKAPDVFVAALGQKSMDMAYGWVCSLNIEGVRADMDFSGRSLKSQMKRADRLGAKYVLMVGDNEIKEGKVILRDMKTKDQVSIPIDRVLKNIKAKIL